MQQVVNQVGQIAQQLWQVSQLVWHWSVGHIVHMFEINFNDLQLWKRMVYVLVVAAIAYLLYKVVEALFKAVQCGLRASDVQSLVSAIWGFFSALAAVRRKVTLAALFAFGGAWIIRNLNPSWMPVTLQ